MLLYKYMPLSPASNGFEKEKDRIKKVLIDCEAYYSTAKQLNDIFELKPQIISPKTAENKKKYIKEAISRIHPNVGGGKRKFLIKSGLKKLKDHNAARDFHWNHVNKYGVFCLTEKSNSPIMWSHYGSRYTGLCIGFDCSISEAGGGDPYWGVVKKVNYQEKYPIIDLSNLTSTEFVIKTIFTKSTEWEYEKEYRFAKRPDEGGGGCSYIFPPEKIKEIIVGPLMEKKEKEFIIGISKELPNVEIYESKISKTKYSIDKGIKVKLPIN